MTTPTFTGIHHLKFPVTDLETNAAWFEKVLGAQRISRFDHRGRDGTLFAVILMMPGVTSPVELRHAPKAAKAVAGYDPVTFGVENRAALDRLADHLDRLGIKHTPVIPGFIGHVLGVETPDGLVIRFYTNPAGGFEHAEFHPEQAAIDAPELDTLLMQRE